MLKKILPNYVLILGDLLVLGVVTLYGFASHNTLDTAGSRIFTTFIPLIISWVLIAPHLKVYLPDVVKDPRQLWRPVWAMVLAAPFAGWVRGVMLNRPVIPLFVVIIGGISAIAILIWRILYWAFQARKQQKMDG